MHTNKLLRFAEMFYSLAISERIPEDSKDINTILKNLENIETYTARKKYAERNLKHLSSGSSRIVYLTENQTVIKLAKNDRGIAQNGAETKAASKIKSVYLNRVLKHAQNYSWVETPYLDKITEKEFEKMTGVSFNNFDEAIRFSLKKISENTGLKKPDNFGKTSSTVIFKEIDKMGRELDLMPGDLARISSFGQKDNHPVLMDSGLTKKVYEDFYEDPSS